MLQTLGRRLTPQCRRQARNLSFSTRHFLNPAVGPRAVNAAWQLDGNLQLAG